MDAECNGHLQAGHRFANWRGGGHFYHPSSATGGRRLQPADGGSSSSGARSFDCACFLIASLCDAKRCPATSTAGCSRRVQDYFADGARRRTRPAEHEVQFPYAYHFDAGLLAEFLRGTRRARGARTCWTTSPTCVARTAAIPIVHPEHGRSRRDLFVDCTGFRGLLLNQALGRAVHLLPGTLPNDSAVALQVPVDIGGQRHRPCTTATAHGRRLGWTIPLWPGRHRLRLLQRVPHRGGGRARILRGSWDPTPPTCRPTTSGCGSAAAATPG